MTTYNIWPRLIKHAMEIRIIKNFWFTWYFFVSVFRFFWRYLDWIRRVTPSCSCVYSVFQLRQCNIYTKILNVNRTKNTNRTRLLYYMTITCYEIIETRCTSCVPSRNFKKSWQWVIHCNPWWALFVFVAQEWMIHKRCQRATNDSNWCLWENWHSVDSERGQS